MEDAYWVEKSRNNDLESYNQLVLKYQQIAFNVAYRISGNTNIADDAVQNGFISGYQKLATFKDGSFKNWILRIVSNACHDLLRKQNRQRVNDFKSDTEGGYSPDIPEWISDEGETPEEFSARQDLGEAIQKCLNDLEEEFRTLVVLVDMQDMNYEEASSVLGKPIGTIKSRLSRARKRLQICLQQFGELLPDKFRFKGEMINE
jgi:RNA polymerase sigma-70 factor, ECF subfamily